jgi:hypothetical protein
MRTKTTNAQMRHARFDLAVGALSVGLTILSYILLRAFTDPKTSMASFGFLGIRGIWGLDGRFYRKKAGEPAVVMDERDKQIRDRAGLLAWRVVWLYWVLACMLPWFVVAIRQGIDAVETATVPLLWLPQALFGGFALYGLTWSLSVLNQYRRDGSEDEQ